MAGYTPKSNGSLLLGYDAYAHEVSPGVVRLDATEEPSLWWQVHVDNLSKAEGRLCLGTNTPCGEPQEVTPDDVADAEKLGWIAAPRKGGGCAYVSRHEGSVILSKCLAHSNRLAVIVLAKSLMQ
jgi:hypothetical protein